MPRRRTPPRSARTRSSSADRLDQVGVGAQGQAARLLVQDRDDDHREVARRLLRSELPRAPPSRPCRAAGCRGRPLRGVSCRISGKPFGAVAGHAPPARRGPRGTRSSGPAKPGRRRSARRLGSSRRPALAAAAARRRAPIGRRNPKVLPTPTSALEPQRAAEQRDDPPAEGQAEPGALLALAPRAGPAGRTRRCARGPRRDPDAVVGHCDRELVVLAVGRPRRRARRRA